MISGASSRASTIITRRPPEPVGVCGAGDTLVALGGQRGDVGGVISPPERVGVAKIAGVEYKILFHDFNLSPRLYRARAANCD